MEMIYGTGNSAKIAYMRRALRGLPIEVTGLDQALRSRGEKSRGKEYKQEKREGFSVLELSQEELKVEETGNTPLENARIKAESYYHFFRSPVFSCDSGLYLWNHFTGEPLPEEEQPGVHVRRRGEGRLSDDELLSYHINLVRKYGKIRARYQNAVCLIWNEKIRAESMEENLWGEPFLLADIPHEKRVEGFPLDSISLDLKTGKYFYDMENDAQDELVSDSSDGFRRFFQDFLEKYGNLPVVG